MREGSHHTQFAWLQAAYHAKSAEDGKVNVASHLVCDVRESGTTRTSETSCDATLMRFA